MSKKTNYSLLCRIVTQVMQPAIPGIARWCSGMKETTLTLESGDSLEVEELSNGEVKIIFKKSITITSKEFESRIKDHIIECSPI